MHDKRAKQPEFIATTRKIERLKEDLDKRELPNLAGSAGICDGPAYKKAQTHEEKIDLIRIKLEAEQKKPTPSQATNPLDLNVQQFVGDQQLTNTSFEKIKKTVDDVQVAHSHTTPKQHPIDLQIQRLETAKKTLTDLRSAEAELLHPKQHRVVRTLKTAAGLIAGATIGALTGSGAAIKTAAKAIKQAPSGIQNTYRQNRDKKRSQNSRG